MGGLSAEVKQLSAFITQLTALPYILIDQS